MRCLFLLLLPAIQLLSCNPRRQYALSQFPADLQSELQSIVNKGYISRSSEQVEWIREQASYTEIKMMARSDQPLIRALGYYLYAKREKFTPDAFFLNALKDTGMINYEPDGCSFCGPGGLQRLYAGEMAAFEMRRRINDYTVDDSSRRLVITDPPAFYRKFIITLPHLETSVWFLRDADIAFDAGLYPVLKKMLNTHHYWYGREHILYRLASYKKPGDVPVIADELKLNRDDWGEDTYKLLATYSDTAYIPAFKALLFQNSREVNNMAVNVQGYEPSAFTPPDLFDCLTMQQDDAYYKLFSMFWIYLNMPGRQFESLPIQEVLLKRAQRHGIAFYKQFADAHLARVLETKETAREYYRLKASASTPQQKREVYLLDQYRYKDVPPSPPPLETKYNPARFRALQAKCIQLNIPL